MPDIGKLTGKNTKCLDQIGGGKPGPGRKPGIPNKAKRAAQGRDYPGRRRSWGQGRHRRISHPAGQEKSRDSAFRQQRLFCFPRKR